jgi:hypothetical protein
MSELQRVALLIGYLERAQAWERLRLKKLEIACRDLRQRSASTAANEPESSPGPQPLSESQDTLYDLTRTKDGVTMEPSNTPIDCGYVVTTSGGPRGSKMAVYPL